MTDLLTPATLPILRSTPLALRAHVSGLPDVELRYSPGGEGWSIHDVVAHLLDTHHMQVGRVHAIVEQDRPALLNVDEEESLEASGLRGQTTLANLAAFVAARATDVPWLASLGDDSLVRAGVHSVAGDVTAANILNQLAYHDALHLGQITRILEAITDVGRGNLRVF